MQGKIGLEEHSRFETLNDSKGFLGDAVWPSWSAGCSTAGSQIERMDRHGMALMLLSLNARGAGDSRPEKGRPGSRVGQRFPRRKVGSARRASAGGALLQDPEEATRELERCVKQLGFVGALVNGFSQIDDPKSAVYLDLPQYWPFWGVVERLDVPFYLHPRNPLPHMAQIYEGHSWLLGPTWAFGQETAVHALRLMGSGLFDKYPGLKIVLGHMGEGLPFSMWRCDNRNAWAKQPPRYPAKRKFGEYFQENFYITTSGNLRTQSLIDAILEIGSDRIMFSTDWPFENIDHAAVWFDAVAISENDRMKIGRNNAVRSSSSVPERSAQQLALLRA